MAGAIGWIDRTVINAVDAMSAALVHRGPDDCGRWHSTDGGWGAALAFRRLAILDLSPHAHQPMVDSSTGNVLVFNGEIYNYAEIRRDLTRAGESFCSTGDSEVLLKAYRHWGNDAVKRLRGMFALAIWDARRRTILIVRDRVGIKPIYYAQVARPDGRSVTLFASEVRSILASGLVKRTLSPMALATYAWNGFVVGEQSIIQDVHLLAAGTMMEIGSGGLPLTSESYWRIPSGPPGRDGVENLEQELKSAIEQHLASDVPLGIFLSGGVDSSAVAALATQVAPSRVRTFNISFDERQFDESRHAAAVASALGTEHTDIRLTDRDFRERLPQALGSLDQPTFDGINTYFVSDAVRRSGITVALAGTGGDELFGGYRSFAENPRASALSRFASVLPINMRRELASYVTRWKCGRPGEVPPQSRWGKLADVLATDGRAVDLHQVSYGLFTDDFMGQLLPNGSRLGTRSGLPEAFAQELDGLIHDRLDYAAVSRLELSCYIGQRLLRDTDSVSMASSLEVRVPLLDHQVIEATMRIEPSQRFMPLGRKQLLRRLALKGLDPNLFNRPKAGFVLPIELWCHQQLQSELDATLEDRELCAAVGLNPDAVGKLWRSFKAGAPGIYWSRVWSLFVLLHWCRSHGVTIG